jgi:predicted transcriptional regulator
MATAVKVDEDAKSRLEELQAEIRLRTGRSVTQQALLTRLIDDAYESRDEVIDSFRESTVPLSEAEKEQMRRGRISSGVETDEDDIDEILYG